MSRKFELRSVDTKVYMQVQVFKEEEVLAQHAASLLLEQVRKKPDSLFCLASGDTPRKTYRLFSSLAKKTAVDLSNCFFIGLDEWVGISPDNSGSCHFFLHENLFSLADISASKIHLFDGMSSALEAECKKMNDLIESKGGIDLLVVGVGMNGHIGFNEPGVSEHHLAHVVALDRTTQQVGQKYFTGETKLEKGITVGMAQCMAARTAFVLATGPRKAGIIHQVLSSEISMDIPATLFRKHPNAFIFLDEPAAENAPA